MNKDHRRLRRRKAAYPITVIDTMTREALGTVVDLSESGLMIVAPTALCADALFQCELHFPPGSGVDGILNTGLHELWSRPEPGSGRTLIGFRIIDISNDDKLRLRRWVAEPGSEYV